MASGYYGNELITYNRLRPEFGITDSRTTIARKIKAGEFPQSIAVSKSRIAWRRCEIEAHLDRLKHGNAVNFRAKK